MSKPTYNCSRHGGRGMFGCACGEGYCAIDRDRLRGSEAGYWCVICNRFLKAEEHEGGNLIVHDDVPHPDDMTFDDQARPQ